MQVTQKPTEATAMPQQSGPMQVTQKPTEATAIPQQSGPTHDANDTTAPTDACSKAAGSQQTTEPSSASQPPSKATKGDSQQVAGPVPKTATVCKHRSMMQQQQQQSMVCPRQSKPVRHIRTQLRQPPWSQRPAPQQALPPSHLCQRPRLGPSTAAYGALWRPTLPANSRFRRKFGRCGYAQTRNHRSCSCSRSAITIRTGFAKACMYMFIVTFCTGPGVGVCIYSIYIYTLYLDYIPEDRYTHACLHIERVTDTGAQREKEAQRDRERVYI